MSDVNLHRTKTFFFKGAAHAPAPGEYFEQHLLVPASLGSCQRCVHQRVQPPLDAGCAHGGVGGGVLPLRMPGSTFSTSMPYASTAAGNLFAISMAFAAFR